MPESCSFSPVCDWKSCRWPPLYCSQERCLPRFTLHSGMSEAPLLPVVCSGCRDSVRRRTARSRAARHTVHRCQSCAAAPCCVAGRCT
eukprot:375324-Pyramimonas_sp.AAC.1